MGDSSGTTSVRRLVTGLAVAVVSCIAIASGARAAPPVLQSVGQTDGHVSATWSLPPDVQSSVIEAATSYAAGTDGYFFRENVSLFDVLQGGQTSYLASSRLDPGTYYVHVQGTNPSSCTSCPYAEWSNVLSVTVPAPPAPPPAPPSPPAAIPAPVAPRLSGPTRQRVVRKALSVTAACASDCGLRATGTVSAAGLRYNLTPTTARLRAGSRVTLKLNIPRLARSAARRALRRHRRVTARITVTARYSLGAPVSTRRIVLLR